jgi:hypothetical protein
MKAGVEVKELIAEERRSVRTARREPVRMSGTLVVQTASRPAVFFGRD